MFETKDNSSGLAMRTVWLPGISILILIFLISAPMDIAAQEKNPKAAPSNPTKDATQTRTIKPGPHENLRKQLWSQLMQAQSRGVGITNYLLAFEQLERDVEAGEAEDKVKARIISLVKTLHQQMRASVYLKTVPFQKVASKKEEIPPDENGGLPPAAPSLKTMTESEMENYMFDLVNKDRRANGVEPLTRNRSLDSLARNHSLDMVKRGFYNHVNPDGLNPQQRADKAGFGAGVGENIATFQGYRSSENMVERAQTTLMDSPPHRRNLLNPDFQGIGIGIAYDDKATGIKVTQNFCK